MCFVHVWYTALKLCTLTFNLAFEIASPLYFAEEQHRQIHLNKLLTSEVKQVKKE